MGALARFFTRLLSWFTVRREPALPSAAASAQALARELDAEAKGRAEALADRPEADAAEDANVAIIRERFAGLVSQRLQQHSMQLISLLQRASQFLGQLHPSTVEGHAMAARDRLGELDARKREDLRGASRAARASARELAAFKHANGLHRSARPAQPLWAVMLFAAAAALIEGAINSWAFAAGASGGWREALFTATVVAALNIAAGLAAGAAAGNLVHVKASRKLAGVAATIVYAAFVVEFTALTARYRSALLVDPDNASMLAAQHIGQLAFGASDFHTICLVLASIGFALLSFGTGLLASDIYPGFSAVSARASVAEARLLAVRASIGDEAAELTDELLDHIDARLDGAAEARSRYASTVAQARAVVCEHEHDQRVITGVYDEQLQRYRRAIRVVHKNGPVAPRDSAARATAAVPLACEPLDTRALEAGEATLRSLDAREAELRAAAQRAKAAIYALRADHAARRDRFIAQAEGTELPTAGGRDTGAAQPPLTLAHPVQAQEQFTH